jgi:cellulose 1,4-beta-cellobiosidase
MKKKFKKLGSIVIAMSLSLSLSVPTVSFAAESDINQEYKSRFETIYSKLKDSKNGYFSEDGVPYHSIETLMVEAPDYGHVTTSEAFSFYMWLEAMNGKLTGDFSGFGESWETAEKYIIPSDKDQPNSSMSRYNPDDPASYAPEWEEPSKYPSELDFDAAVGKDPIGKELASAYGTNMIYGMHWLLDVDNWYGFGLRGDGKSKNSYINTFQRGIQESTWETIPQPCYDNMKFGGVNGFLDLFTGDKEYAKQFKYTNAPDADARAVQATYWANIWAKEENEDVSTYVEKATKMGDYLRYAMFDKYFRKIGSSSTAGSGYDSAHYLMSWYYAWGGGIGADWAWKIGCSHNHFGYQNPLAAYALSTDSDFKPKSKNGASDWDKSLTRQIEFYQWLQSDEGAIAGGASNSYNGRYEKLPSGTSTFYGMGYVENPVYHDPGSNTWFGMQTWSMQRMAEYYYQSKDENVKPLLDKWTKWANSVIKFNADGTFQIPNKIDWEGQPDKWNGKASSNSNLHVSIVNYGTDLGIASSLANTLAYYAAASGDETSQKNAKRLLDGIWDNYQDEKGISVPEEREDYKRFLEQEVYVPSGWTGKMPNGDLIKSGVNFIDIRSKYRDDPDWSRVEADLKAGKAPTMVYHRFWAQSEFAIANGVYAILFPSDEAGETKKGDLNGDSNVDALDLALMKKYILDNSVSINKANADINNDDDVNAIDFALLKKLVLG